jgi:hypothetical protein
MSKEETTLSSAAAHLSHPKCRADIDGLREKVLIIDNPTLPDSKNCINRKIRFGPLEFQQSHACSVSEKRHRGLSAKHLKMLETIASNHPNMIKVFDTIPIMCRAGTCSSKWKGRLLYEYSDHVSDYGAGLIGQRLNAFITEVI